jgi:hypothetical protein
MTARRKHTDAIKFLTDEVSSAEDFHTAAPAVVDRYLQSKGVKLTELDSKIDRFMAKLGGKIAMARATRERGTAQAADPRKAKLAGMSDEQLLAKLVAVYGSKEAIPLAARTKKALGRVELESLYLDANDE